MPAITESLRAAIQTDGRSIYQIGQDSGVPPPTLYRFLAGQRGLTGETIDALAKGLGLELRKKTSRNPPSVT